MARALHQLGVNNGDHVSCMGYALTDHAWAYMAGVRIVSEIPVEDVLSFWAAKDEQKGAVVQWLASTSSKALVTRSVPDTALLAGWRKVGDTDYYILPLSVEVGKQGKL